MIRDIARWITLGGVFLLPFLPLIVTNTMFFPFITGKNFAFRIIVEVIVASWAVLALADAKYRPRFSYILVGFGALLGIMALADAFGVSPHKSFWSNYERMDGYVTLFHLGLYLLVAGSVLNAERLWFMFFHTSIAVAIGMTLYGFCQMSGSPSCPVSQDASGVRLDGRMGNAAYLAVYMFFHIFFVLFYMVRANKLLHRFVYAGLAGVFTFILFHTATRGTVLALLGGLFVSALYIAIFERANRLIQQVAIGGIVVVAIIAGSFFLVKDTQFVQGNPILQRLSTISVSAGETRFTIWKLALEGIKERPILGWGQENFNYVFNQHYRASLYNQEPWFDRVHNLVLDWLIAGGILGLLAYLFIIAATLYYVVIRPFLDASAESFTVLERGVLLGLLAGYVAHNLLVFDNLISYFLFATVLAFIHSRFATEIPSLARVHISPDVISNIAAPTAIVAACAVVYMVNVPSINASMLLIESFQVPTTAQKIELYEKSLQQGSFANQEIREQLARIAQQATPQAIATEIRTMSRNAISPADADKKAQEMYTKLVDMATNELNKQIAETPDDARIAVFLGSFYRSLGKNDEAVKALTRAVELSPQKQMILFELGYAQFQKNDTAAALETFKKAFELEPEYLEARMQYAAAAIYAKDYTIINKIITASVQEEYMKSDAILRAYYNMQRYDDVIKLLNFRITGSPDDSQLRVSLAAIQEKKGDRAAAIQTLEQAIKDIPSFADKGEEYLKTLRAGKTPQ